MTAIYLVGLMLIGVFSGLVGAYWAIYKVERGWLVRTVTFAGVTLATFLVATVLGIFAIWPPFWPL